MSERDELYSITDVCRVVGECLADAKYDDEANWISRLEYCRSKVSGWLIPEQERHSLLGLIDAAAMACESLADV